MFELVDLWHMVIPAVQHTKGNCIFSVSKLEGRNSSCFTMKIIMVRCPTLQNTSLAYFETASRTKVFDTTATHRHIPTQQCRPRC